MARDGAQGAGRADRVGSPLRLFLLALLLAAAVPCAAQESALDRAYTEVVAARAALQKAEEARKAGEEPREGERQGIVAPPSQRQRSRLGEDYWKRQKQLESQVEAARARLDGALKRWNALR